jgi:hypothetical protein
MSYFQPTGTTLIARRGYGGPTPTGLDGVLDKIGDFVKNGVSAAVNVYTSGQQAAGQAAAYQSIAQQQAALAAQSRTPGWVMPVAIGGAALAVGAFVLSRKRRNPSRRRR